MATFTQTLPTIKIIMSRSISIWYKQDNADTNIEVGNRDLLGTQSSSMKFWSLQSLQDFGIKELTKLGYTDPVWFKGSEDLDILGNEISILERNKERIDFDEELRNRWIENLRFCFEKLTELTPPDSVPNFMIG